MKHHELPGTEPTKTEPALPSVAEKLAAGPAFMSGDVAGHGKIQELLEKNLKWSQILYEQNRKLNRKLLWLAISGWFRFFVIAIPLGFAVWYLPPVIQKVSPAFEQMLDLLPLATGEKSILESLTKQLK